MDASIAPPAVVHNQALEKLEQSGGLEMEKLEQRERKKEVNAKCQQA
jgi:hypothetical protein